MAVEYPGFGVRRDNGKPSEAAMIEAGEDMMAHLSTELDVPPRPVRNTFETPF